MTSEISIRFWRCHSWREDEKDLDLVHFDISLYDTYVKGYFGKVLVMC